MGRNASGGGGGGAAFTQVPARYAKGRVAVRPSDSYGGYKGEASYLAQGLGGKWSNRERAYIMTPAAAARIKVLSRRRITYSPITGEFYRRGNIDKKISRADVMRMK